MSEIITHRQPLLVNPAEQEVEKPNAEAKAQADAAEAAEKKRFADLTPEELEAQRQEFVDIAVRGIRRKKEEKKAEEPKSEEEVKPAEAAADDKAKEKKGEAQEDEKQEEPPPAKATKAKRKVTEPPSVDTALKDAITHGVERAVRPLVDKLTPQEPKIDLSERDKKRLEVIRHLESTNPAYKGLTVKTLDFWRREKDYKEAWEAKNPDQPFEPGAEDHSSFYQKHEPQFTDDDLEAARESLIEDRLSKKLEGKYSERLNQVEMERKFESSRPEIEQSANSAMLDFIPLAVESFKGLMEDGKGGARLTPEIVEKMKETDPEAFEVMDAEGEKLRIELKELDTLTKFPGYYKFNPELSTKTNISGERIFPHAALKTFVDDLESELDKMPRTDTERDGKDFITHSEYAAKTKSLEGEPKAERESALKEIEKRFWWLQTPEIRRALIKDRAGVVERYVKRFEARAQRLAKVANGETSEQRAERQQAETEKADQKRQEEQRRATKPPNTSISSDKVDTSKKGGDQSGISDEIWLKKVTGG